MTDRGTEAGSAQWITEEVKNKIKETVSIRDVLADNGLLEGMQEKGSRLKGKSPWRPDEVSPSFFVDLEKNIWNDFGDEGGDLFKLVQKIKGCSFREALVYLHDTFFVVGSASPEQETMSERRRVSQVLEGEAGEKENVPFGRELKGRTNIPPLIERGISEETIRKFGVVYCTAGMMKGRIAFPIRSRDGEIMAYAGRAVKQADEEENGKYRFPPRFNKLLELYNIDRIVDSKEAKKAVKDFGLIVVEGFTDVLRLDQEGFPNVVALMGSVMGPKQKAMLLDPQINPTRRLTLFLDNDKAGEQGKRKIASECIYGEGFVRYVPWGSAPEGNAEPEHFDRDQLIKFLGFERSQ